MYVDRETIHEGDLKWLEGGIFPCLDFQRLVNRKYQNIQIHKKHFARTEKTW